MSLLRKLLGIISLLQMLAMWALNLVWYKQILVGLGKLLGIIKVSKKTHKN
jgi:hypothetical protein